MDKTIKLVNGSELDSVIEEQKEQSLLASVIDEDWLYDDGYGYDNWGQESYIPEQN